MASPSVYYNQEVSQEGATQAGSSHKEIKKVLDKSKFLMYNIENKTKEITTMKFRVTHPKYFPTYFKTKRAAILFQEQMGGTIERKIGGNWCGY